MCWMQIKMGPLVHLHEMGLCSSHFVLAEHTLVFLDHKNFPQKKITVITVLPA